MCSEYIITKYRPTRRMGGWGSARPPSPENSGKFSIQGDNSGKFSVQGTLSAKGHPH